MELVHCDQPVVEPFHAVLIDCEAERRVSADQHLVAALKKRPNRLDLSAVVLAGRVAEVPFWLYAPVGPKSKIRERLIVEARADGLFRHNDDCLLDPLVLDLIEGDEHERTALAGCGW